MNSVTHNKVLAVVWLVLGIACGSSDETRQDSGGRDVASSSTHGDVAQATGGRAGGAGGAGGLAGTGGRPATGGASSLGGGAGTGGVTTTGGGSGRGGATTTADGGLAPDGRDALPDGRDALPEGRDALPIEAGADQPVGVDVGVEARGYDTTVAEAAGHEVDAVDAPTVDRPADVVRVDSAVDPGVDLSDCPNAYWLDDLINSSSYDRPDAIDRYSYQGAVVFYTPPKYADQYSTLYDRCGTILCHPDGGFTGHGDGQCPNFSDLATGRTSIWPTP